MLQLSILCYPGGQDSQCAIADKVGRDWRKVQGDEDHIRVAFRSSSIYEKKIWIASTVCGQCGQLKKLYARAPWATYSRKEARITTVCRFRR